MMTLMKSMAAMTVASAVVAAPALAQEVRLSGAGATFPQPLYERWAADFQKANPSVKIEYGGGGSGAGIKAISDKTVAFGASDAPLTKKEIDAAGGSANLVEIPTCAGAVVPAYNLPGVEKPLNFTGELIADIFMGKVSKWNDAKIAELNPGVKLPETSITPAWRTDGSGTTFVFTNYLATQSDTFKGSVGMGKQVKWPTGQGGKGNPGVAAVVQQTPGAIGYIELNYAEANKIAYGAVKNKDGKFIHATADSVSSAGSASASGLSGNHLTADIWNQAGADAYPISTFTYLIVYKDLGNLKSQQEAEALINFLTWATVGDGQKVAKEMGYAPLSKPVQEKVGAAIKSLSFVPAKK
jgi:phosphate transport system substrate-binding protein